MLTRQEIIKALDEGLRPNEDVRVAWIGGSDANGREDELSDVDLFVLAAKGKTETAAAAIESIVSRLSPIRIRFRLPMPTWHGFHQAFYQLENAPEHLMIDWLIVEQGQPHPWLEVERHGRPMVLFDKDGHVKPAHVDRASIAGAMDKKVAELRIKFPLFRHLPIKLVERNLPVDAAYFYQALILRPLVDILRCLHCPDRYDFGFRYVRDDLPPPLYDALVRLSYFARPADLLRHVDEASGLFAEAVGAWDSRRK